MLGHIAAAAANNADWCSAVCRAHDIVTTAGPRVWTAATRTPDGYPDAVTLSPDASVDDILDRVGVEPGCSVKDSFAALNLTTRGFRVLLEGQWIYRDIEQPSHVEHTWTPVTRAADLYEWAEAHGNRAAFREGLLTDQQVRILARRDGDGRICCGAALNRSADVVGVSNVFTSTVEPDLAWRELVAAATEIFPETPLAGWETAGDLSPAAAAAFRPIGPLRVWLAD